MEVGEELLIEFSNDGGQTYRIINRIVSGIDFLGPQWTIVSIPLAPYNPSAESIIRLRCNASSTADKVFIDDLALLDCSLSEGRNFTVETAEIDVVDITVYPNPTTDFVTIATDIETIKGDERITVELVNRAGQLLTTQPINKINGTVTLDLSSYASQQMYFIRTVKDGKLIHNEKLIKI